MMLDSDNYFLKYHSLVLNRILQGQTELYSHQQEALLAIYQKACRGGMDAPEREAALILAGVGTGKTLIQAIAPFILAPWMQGKVALFLSDNCTLRARFLKDFPTDYKHRPLYNEWLLYRLKVLPPGVPPPKIVELDASDFNSYAYCLNEADMLVGNRQFLVNLVSRGDIEPSLIGVIITDEAHFSAANSYRTICNYFDKALLAYFTGSKFRSDSQPLPHVRYTQVEDVIREEVPRERVRPLLTTEYEAGETILHLSDTSTVKPGDMLQLRVPVVVREDASPKFSLKEELRFTSSLSENGGKSLRVAESGGSYGMDEDGTPLTPLGKGGTRLEEFGKGETGLEEQDAPLFAQEETGEKSTPLPWQREVDAIAEKLTQIRSIKTYEIQVEAVLDNRTVQITPAWSDIPKGVGIDITKPREPREIKANFLSHVGLDWQILVGEELMSYRDYSRRVILQKCGFDLDDEGEIIVGGVRLKDTMPQAAYDLFLKGLETELASEVVEVPHPEVVTRPDKAKMETQATLWSAGAEFN